MGTIKQKLLRPGPAGPTGRKDMAILKLRQDDERAEAEFELDYLTSLTTRERFELMLRKSREMALLLRRHGRRRTTKISKRT